MSKKFVVNEPSRTAVIVCATTCAVSVASFFVEISPHSFFIEKYRKIIARYKRGEEVPLHKDVKKLFDEVLDDLKIKNQKYRNSFKPFTITGFDVYNAGVNDTDFGVIIGIPGHFAFKDKFAVDVLDIRVGNNREPLNPYHPATDDLIDSFVLSDKAKKFAIAREVLMSQQNLPVYRSIESPMMISLTVIMCDVVTRHFDLFDKPKSTLAGIYFGIGVLGFTTWFHIRDSLNVFFEKKVDKQLAELGPAYIEGGKEFYSKLLKRNIALRKILGADGSRIYNRDGDEKISIRQKSTPLTYRKKFFDQYNSLNDATNKLTISEPQAA